MSAPAKFLFDTDFGRTARAEQTEPSIAIAAHELIVADKSAAAYREGFAAASAETDRRGAMALERVAEALGRLSADLSSVEEKIEAEAVHVAVAVGRKLSSALIAREPLAEIETLAANCFAQFVSAPHVVIRIADSLYLAARERLEELACRTGFDGRLVILAEPHLAEGDCRIEWADGGLVRDRAAADSAIAELVARYVAARHGDAPQSGGLER